MPMSLRAPLEHDHVLVDALDLGGRRRHKRLRIPLANNLVLLLHTPSMAARGEPTADPLMMRRTFVVSGLAPPCFGLDPFLNR